MDTNEHLDGKVEKVLPEVELAEKKIARAHKLKHNEWQRLVPLVNIYRVSKDYFTGDDKILSQLYSKTHNKAVKVWYAANMAAAAIGAGYGLGLLIKMLGEQK